MPKSMIDDQYLLATNPETTPEILRELSQSDDRAIRQAVAGNPNVPIELLWELNQEFPYEILANPAFIFLTMEDQRLLASNPETAPGCLRELSYHSDPLIAGTVAQNPNTPTDSLRTLIRDYPHEICTNPILPIILLEYPFWLCSIEPEDFVCILNNPEVPEILLEALQDSCLTTKQYLVRKHPEVLLLHLQKLRFDQQLYLAKSRRGKRSIHLLKKLANNTVPDANWHIRICQAVARNPGTPEQLLSQLADSPYKAVRVNVARHQHLTKLLLIKLAIDPYSKVQQTLLANTNIQPNLLAELKTHPDLKISQFAQQHPNTPK
jgi:hypothetical protein